MLPSVASPAIFPARISSSISLALGIALGFSLSLSYTGFVFFAHSSWRRLFFTCDVPQDEIVDGVEGLIGNTPLLRIKSLSALLGVEILGKCEFLNPFGSVKDRVSLQIIQEAEAAGLLTPNTGDCIFEGTSGSTGISIAGIARSRGHKAHIVLPDDVACEKVQLLEALGAHVEKVRPVSIVDKRHYVNLARQRALQFGQSRALDETSFGSMGFDPASPTSYIYDAHAGSSPSPAVASSITQQGLFADQFENLSNLTAHERTTGPEIWRQTNGKVDAFVSGSGTGGTIAGVGRYLKRMKRDVQIVLSDPQGSGLFHKVRDGVMYDSKEQEGKRRRYQVDTIVEGIGLNRLTANFSAGLDLISNAYRVTDAEAVAMSRHLALHDGLFLGSSAAVNLVACVRLAQSESFRKEAGKVIVTILCDSGTRHLSKFWNDDYLRSQGIPISPSIDSILQHVV